MLKSEMDRMFRRCIEETKAEFTEEQIQCIILAMNKICGRMVEEALASFRPGSGGRSGYFAD
ncbi:MAG: hypothetical protein K2X77_19570 [Candidatus Obscuribacterales bacterium]|jgi:hypothetical protein|nr:hypothetical protein [Candidatus Obscuribacterales bacterium]